MLGSHDCVRAKGVAGAADVSYYSVPEANLHISNLSIARDCSPCDLAIVTPPVINNSPTNGHHDDRSETAVHRHVYSIPLAVSFSIGGADDSAGDHRWRRST